jgi:hypothetical protein
MDGTWDHDNNAKDSSSNAPLRASLDSDAWTDYIVEEDSDTELHLGSTETIDDAVLRGQILSTCGIPTRSS